jgi:hypothetical protein
MLLTLMPASPQEQSLKEFLSRPEHAEMLEKQQQKEFKQAMQLKEKMRALEFRNKVRLCMSCAVQVGIA